MAEGAPLLRAYGLTLIEGSNPSLSARMQKARSMTGLFAFWLRGRFYENPRFERRDSAADARILVRPAGVK